MNPHREMLERTGPYPLGAAAASPTGFGALNNTAPGVDINAINTIHLDLAPRNLTEYLEFDQLYWLKPFPAHSLGNRLDGAKLMKTLRDMMRVVQKRGQDSLRHLFTAKKENVELLHIYPVLRGFIDDCRNYDGIHVSHACLVTYILHELL